jgi:hypothetical protein
VGYEHFDVNAAGFGGIGVKRWGRLAVITPPGAPDTLQELTITGWKPDRSMVRLHSLRFIPANDSSIDIVRLSNTVLWIAGNEVDPDGAISIEGPFIGSTRVSTAILADGPPDIPLFVSLSMPSSLTGRVETDRFQEVVGAEVDLFEPLNSSIRDKAAVLEHEAMILHRTARSGFDGSFTFERLGPAPYLLVVHDPKHGRGTLTVAGLSEPAIVRLVSPLRATGRILKHRVPAGGVRVRFVPDAEAYGGSLDPSLFFTEATTSAADGRFELILPPLLVGTVQVSSTEGSAVRIPLVGRPHKLDINLGDLALPDVRRLTVRLSNAESCVMSAVGPLGAPGLSIVRSSAFEGVHSFDLPEAGQWALDAQCNGISNWVQPPVVRIPEQGPDTMLDARVDR